VSAFGLCTDKAKVNFWRHETLPLPLAYLDQPLLVESLKRVLSLANEVANQAVRKASWAAAASLLTPGEEQRPDTDRVRSLVDSLAAERLYWSRLERPFREVLMQLPGDEAHQERCIRDWFADSLRRGAVEAYDRTVGRLDSARDLKAVNRGRDILFSRLLSIQGDARIPNPEEGETA
jgi:CRISPR system Cascade subunit CasA